MSKLIVAIYEIYAEPDVLRGIFDVTTLLIGFDSAWTPRKRGAIVAALRHQDGSFRDLGSPRLVDFQEAESAIRMWQVEHVPTSTLILLDQPTVVENATGQRPVEHIACASVSVRRGGVRPANTGRADMFGLGAPVWALLAGFGGAADPTIPGQRGGAVFETYPVLAMIALGWVREDARAKGRLPKYNPDRKKTCRLEDWRYLCDKVSAVLREHGLSQTALWVDGIRDLDRPKKSDQDRLDACLCLLVALHLAERSEGLMVGDRATGYIVVPHCAALQEELADRCKATSRLASDWIRTFRLS